MCYGAWIADCVTNQTIEHSFILCCYMFYLLDTLVQTSKNFKSVCTDCGMYCVKAQTFHTICHWVSTQ